MELGDSSLPCLHCEECVGWTGGRGSQREDYVHGKVHGVLQVLVNAPTRPPSFGLSRVFHPDLTLSKAVVQTEY